MYRYQQWTDSHTKSFYKHPLLVVWCQHPSLGRSVEAGRVVCVVPVLIKIPIRMRSFCNCFVALLISYFTATFAIPSDCPPPREYPSLQFETCGNPRLQVQRNFNRISIWGVTPESGLVSVVATENLNRLQKWVATNFSVELELERTVGSRDGWFVACGMYDYVIHHRKSCSFCSFFRLCRVDPQPILDCSVEGTEGPQESSNLFSTRSCEDQIVSLLPDDQKETNSASLSFFISAYFDELPITEAILSVKVVKISLCVPDKVSLSIVFCSSVLAIDFCA